MKKTFSINITGFLFTIDEDAFTLLSDYIETIKNVFDKDNDTEISDDIESRIAEILMEMTSGGNGIITYRQVEEVISRIGHPEEFIAEEVSEEKAEEKIVDLGEETEKPENGNISEPPPYHPSNPIIKKKLFRDVNNSVIGGVCSGLAWYLGIDVTILRLIAVLLFFLSASTVTIVYIILWLVVPPAKTPFQQMMMKGESPTLENIERNVTGKNVKNYAYDNNYVNYENKNTGSGAFSIIGKILLVIAAIIGAPVLLIILFILVVCLLAFFGLSWELITNNFGEFGLTDIMFREYSSSFSLLLGIGILLVLGVPVLIVILNAARKQENKIRGSRFIPYLVVWIVGILLIIFPSIALYKAWENLDYKDILSRVNEEKIENPEELSNVDFDKIEGVDINIDSDSYNDSILHIEIVKSAKTDTVTNTQEETISVVTE